MTNPHQRHAASLLNYQRTYDNGAVLKWCGINYTCSPGSDQTGHDLEFGGHLGTARRSVTIARSLFANGRTPTHGENVELTPYATAKPIEYKVDIVSDAPGGEVVRITLKSRNES